MVASIRLIEENQHECDDHGRVSYWLTDARLLCFIAGWMLLAASILSFPYVWTAVSSGGSVTAPFSFFMGSMDSDAFKPVLLEDLMRQGLLKPEDRTVFLKKPSSAGWRPTLVDRTVDFILSSDSSGVPDFPLADRALKVGGIIAVRLGEEEFDMPPNYRLVYVKRFNSTVVAMRKISHSDGNAAGSGTGRRRLLAIPDSIDDVLLEPPASRRLGRTCKRAPYVPLWARSLDQHARVVFVDVGSPGRATSEDWFKKNYAAARSQTELEVVRLNVAEGGTAGSEGITEWLAKNVKKEEYVVMKAEAEVAEEMVKEGSIGLVDEMFLECSHQWEKGRKGLRSSKRAYWECLALYGKIRDEGVAVHQWWG